MANLNKVILIGRLTRDPESRSFASGGKIAKFGFAVTNRKRNAQTNQWEDEPMFIDCEAYNRGEHGKLADTVEQYCRKGSQVCIEGRLHLDQWEDKNGGGKRTKHKIVVEAVQLLDRREDGNGGSAGGGSQEREPARSSSGRGSYGGSRDQEPAADEIPF